MIGVQAQGTWEAPVVPGVNLSAWGNSEKVYIYNVEADAFVTGGMNWNTNAISTRLTNGDDKASNPHSAAVTVNGSNIKMVMDLNTGRAIGTNGGDFDCWIDFDHNQDWTFAASEKYANAYTLINAAYANKKLDVAALYGGKLTIGGGKGFYDWAFIPVTSITDGSYLKYKEKKVMYGIYQALVTSGKTATYATALETANAVYVNASATAAQLRTATRALIIAVADGIESRVDVTPLFTNADMVGAASASSWGPNNGISWATFEQYHAKITLSQTQTDVPNGLYDVLFNGFFRQDGSDAAPVVTGVGSSQVNGNVIEMRTMASTWGCNTNGGNNWRDQGGNIVPDGMKSAGQGLAYEGASTSLNNIPVKANSLTISATVNSTSQWFIWQGFRIYYNGAINLAVYKKILAAVDVANSLTGAMSATAKSNLTTAVDATDGLSANSDEDELNTALANLETAISDANASIAIYTEIRALLDGLKTQDADFDGETKYNAGSYTAVSEVYAEYYAYEVNKLGSAANTDYTKAIVNPGFEFGNTIGWTYEPSVDHGAKSTTNNTYKMTDSEGSYLFNIWSAGHPITQTITNLPTGLYELKAVVANNSDGDPAKVYLIANDIHEGITCNVDAGTGVEGSVKAVVSDGSLTIGAVGSNNDAERSYIEGGVWWYKVDNFRLTYLGDVVSDEEAAAILASVPSGAMNSSVKDVLDDAVSAFEESHTTSNYQALQVAINNANTSISAYANAKNAIDAAKAIQENTNVVTAAAAATYALAVTSAETSYNNGTWTNEEANNAGTTLGVSLTGWHGNASGAAGVYMESAWDNAPNFGDYYINTWSTEGENDGSDFKVPFFEYWTSDANSLGAKTLTATVEGLIPNGAYSVSAWVRVHQTDNQTKVAKGITLQVGDGAAIDVTGGTQVGTTPFYLGTFTAAGFADGEGNLKVKFNVAANSNISWLSFKNAKYGDAAVATAEDYAALNAAIENAEANTLGFEDGEYAPYNNIDALKALADAKAIDQTATNVQFVVQAATTALTGATWTANAEEVNAVWDGSFEYDYRATTPSGNINPYGWQRVKDAAADGYNVRYQDGNDPGLAATSSHKALFTKQSAYYGYADGYTMPLKANTVYKVTFVYGGWNDCKKDGYVSMTDPEGNPISLTVTDLPLDATTAHQDPNVWKSYTAYFTTGEAGNYVLGLRKKNYDTSGQSQYVYGDIVLKKAYESANLTVNSGKIGTFIAPFDVTLPEGVKAYSAEVDGDELKLTKIKEGGEKLDAGTPVVVYGDEVNVNETFYGVPTVFVNKSAGNLFGILEEGKKEVPAGAYVLQTQTGGQAFYKVATAAPGALNRCYVIAASPNARLVISFDGEDPTAINAIEAAEAEDGALKDGKYIIDNKVVIVKNGVKYSANGQILK